MNQEQPTFQTGMLVRVVKPNRIPSNFDIQWPKEMDRTNGRSAYLGDPGRGGNWDIPALGFYYHPSWLRVVTKSL